MLWDVKAWVFPTWICRVRKCKCFNKLYTILCCMRDLLVVMIHVLGWFIDTGTREQSLSSILIGSNLVCESCAVEEFFFICNHPSNVSVVRGGAMHLSTCCGPSCQGLWYCLEFLSRRSNGPFRSLWANFCTYNDKGYMRILKLDFVNQILLYSYLWWLLQYNAFLWKCWYSKETIHFWLIMHMNSVRCVLVQLRTLHTLPTLTASCFHQT